ncbi:MAG: hypothetical protein JST28_09190 [Acidobacteria bacterium]|nr:hypothetical protein [Acidobacteriota bacterium]
MSDDNCEGCAELIQRLRGEIDTKHNQNRTDIHGFRNQVQAMLLEMSELRGKIIPIVGGDGQPGILAQLRTELEGLRTLITDLRIAQGADVGRRGENTWLRDHAATIVIGLLLVLAGHFWK